MIPCGMEERFAEALDTLQARGFAVHRLRQMILENALGCEYHRRAYGANVLYKAAHPEPYSRVGVTAEELAAVGADQVPCTCGLGKPGQCGRGSCS